MERSGTKLVSPAGGAAPRAGQPAIRKDDAMQGDVSATAPRTAEGEQVAGSGHAPAKTHRTSLWRQLLPVVVAVVIVVLPAPAGLQPHA